MKKLLIILLLLVGCGVHDYKGNSIPMYELNKHALIISDIDRDITDQNIFYITMRRGWNTVALPPQTGPVLELVL